MNPIINLRENDWIDFKLNLKGWLSNGGANTKDEETTSSRSRNFVNQKDDVQICFKILLIE